MIDFRIRCRLARMGRVKQQHLLVQPSPILAKYIELHGRIHKPVEPTKEEVSGACIVDSLDHIPTEIQPMESQEEQVFSDSPGVEPPKRAVTSCMPAIREHQRSDCTVGSRLRRSRLSSRMWSDMCRRRGTRYKGAVTRSRGDSQPSKKEESESVQQELSDHLSHLAFLHPVENCGSVKVKCRGKKVVK